MLLNNITPLKSVRKYCLWCCNNSFKETNLCSCTDCPLHDFRMGKKVRKGSIIKIIRQRCLDCKGGDKKSVRECEFKDCPLYHYRMGSSPVHKKLWLGKRPACGFKKGKGPVITKKAKQGL